MKNVAIIIHLLIIKYYANVYLMLKNIICKHGSLVVVHRDFQVAVLQNKKLDRAPGQEQRQKWFIGTTKEGSQPEPAGRSSTANTIQSTGTL